MANARQRDTVDGIATSASAEEYRRRRSGTLLRRSGGYRTPYEIPEPRRELRPGYKPDPPLAPYAYNPASPAQPPWPTKPNTHAFFRQPDLGAPRVGFPDAKRTAGHIQQSGEAWGKVGEAQRETLLAPRDGVDGPPVHPMGQHRPSSGYAAGSRWKRPDTPTLRDHMPH
jgi:hypothetical protein